jgi:hypothetical protein
MHFQDKHTDQQILSSHKAFTLYAWGGAVEGKRTVRVPWWIWNKSFCPYSLCLLRREINCACEPDSHEIYINIDDIKEYKVTR